MIYLLLFVFFPNFAAMKMIRVPILFLLLLALAACHSPQREARQMARRAERLFDTMPDSTFKLIDSILRMPVYFNEKHRMDLALLQGEALFGDRGQEIPPLMDDEFFDDKPFLSTSPELERAADYYARKKQYAKAAHAALYSGFIQQHYNEKQAAMQSFKDAERYGEMVKDSLTVARAEYWMGRMLFDEGNEQEAFNLLEISEQRFSHTNVEKALAQNMKAVCCLAMGNLDDAEFFLQQGLFNIEMNRTSKVRIRIFNNYAVLYRLQGKYNQAIVCLKQNSIDSDIDEKGALMLYLNLGNVFMDMNKIDSAEYYYQKLKMILPVVQVKNETKVSAYGALSRFAEKQDLLPLALEYRKKHEEFLYSVMNHRQEKNVFRIQRQYDYENLQNTMNQKLARTQRVIAVGIVLLLSVVALFLYHLAKRNKKEAEINANLFHFMQQNEELKQRHEEFSHMNVDRNQKISDLLSDKFRAMQKLDYFIKNQGDKSPLRELENELFDGKDHMEAMMDLFETMYPGLQSALKEKYPNMTNLEYNVYLLSRFKLSRVEEATLLGISTSVLDKVRGRVRKMMENG